METSSREGVFTLNIIAMMGLLNIIAMMSYLKTAHMKWDQILLTPFYSTETFSEF